MVGSLSNHLNTQGCCFLCLRSKDPLNNLNGVEFDFYSLNYLLRHLQIDNSEGKGTASGVQVNLCDECRKITGKFSNLFRNMEKIQLEMNYILERIHWRILASAKNSWLVQNYSKRMTSDLQSLSELVVVDKLRKQVENKCLKMQKGPKLRVELPKIQPKISVKEETDKADEDHPGQDDFDSIPIVADSLLFKLPSPTYSTASEDFPEEQIEAASSQVKDSEPEEMLPPPNFPKRSKPLVYYKNHGMYHCKKCPKSFKSSTGVRCHYKILHSKLTLKCDICKVAQFATTTHLKRHQRTCRENLGKKLAKIRNPEFKFICKCKKIFKNRQGLRSHLQSHSNIRNWACDLCDRSFKAFNHLKDHKETIHFGRKFNCRFCNKIFSQRSTRGKHEKSCVDRPNEN